jgi:hypothetical protein
MSEQSLIRIRLAVRVLSCYYDTPPQLPDVSDIDALRACAETMAEAALPLDELACMIVHREQRNNTAELESAVEA